MPPSDSAFWGSSIFQQEQGWAVRIFRGGDRDGGGEVEKKKKKPQSVHPLVSLEFKSLTYT